MTTPDRAPTEPASDASADEVQADIERTRAELGDTVNALTAKFDVKARASHAATDTKNRIVDKATDDYGRIKTTIPLAVTAVVVTAIIVAVWRRRR
jgi:hypothetical protein